MSARRVGSLEIRGQAAVRNLVVPRTPGEGFSLRYWEDMRRVVVENRTLHSLRKEKQRRQEAREKVLKKGTLGGRPRGRRRR